MPMGARSVLKVDEAHRDAAWLLRSDESHQSGLTGERAALLRLHFFATHDLHRFPSFLVRPSHSMVVAEGTSVPTLYHTHVRMAPLMAIRRPPGRKTASYASREIRAMPPPWPNSAT